MTLQRSARWLAAAACLALFAMPGFAGGGADTSAGEGLHIVVATDATWPPMEMVDEDKQIVGFDIDLMQAIAREGGFTVEFRNTAWDGIFAGLGSGRYDAVMSSVTITDERKQAMDFSDPYINAGQVLIVRQDAATNVAELADLSGKSVGAQIGTTGAFAVEETAGVTLKTYDEIGLAIEDLANGRIDGVVADTPVAADYALQNENYRQRLQVVGEPFTEEFYGIAVAKGNTGVLSAINAGLAKVLASGENVRIEERWLR